MSFWRRLFGKGKQPEHAAAERQPSSAVAPPADLAHETSASQRSDNGDPQLVKELALLRRVERPGGAGATEALTILRSHQGRASQGAVLGALLEGLEGAADAPDPASDGYVLVDSTLPFGATPVEPAAVDGQRIDGLRVACAHLLDERGERARALTLVEPGRSIEAMMLAADLHAAVGNVARAVGSVERVMARSIDAPGARERHARWSALLGRGSARARVDDSATVVAPATSAKLPFRLLREVARGGAGTVYEAEDELLGRRVAFKVYHRSEQSRAQIEREARTAVALRGPGVMRIFDADPEQGWLAAEWLGLGSLRDRLVAARVREALPLSSWVPALVAALGRVHERGLVHADIKPANVMFRAQYEPVLGDFGISRAQGEPSLGGTPGYLAPERLGGSSADARDDVYALGRVLEDVLAAREDAGLDAAVLGATAEDARWFARIALLCLRDAASRPANATELLALLGE